MLCRLSPLLIALPLCPANDEIDQRVAIAPLHMSRSARRLAPLDSTPPFIALTTYGGRALEFVPPNMRLPLTCFRNRTRNPSLSSCSNLSCRSRRRPRSDTTRCAGGVGAGEGPRGPS